MRKIEKIITFDGKEHTTEAAANIHLDNLLGAIVDKWVYDIADCQKVHPLRNLLFAMFRRHAAEVAEIENDRFLFTEQD